MDTTISQDSHPHSKKCLQGGELERRKAAILCQPTGLDIRVVNRKWSQNLSWNRESVWWSDQNGKSRKLKDIFPEQRTNRIGEEKFGRRSLWKTGQIETSAETSGLIRCLGNIPRMSERRKERKREEGRKADKWQASGRHLSILPCFRIYTLPRIDSVCFFFCFSTNHLDPM